MTVGILAALPGMLELDSQSDLYSQHDLSMISVKHTMSQRTAVSTSVLVASSTAIVVNR